MMKLMKVLCDTRFTFLALPSKPQPIVQNTTNSYIFFLFSFIAVNDGNGSGSVKRGDGRTGTGAGEW